MVSRRLGGDGLTPLRRRNGGYALGTFGACPVSTRSNAARDDDPEPMRPLQRGMHARRTSASMPSSSCLRVKYYI